MKTEIMFKEESFKIIGACFEVYNGMGHGFLEAVYQNAWRWNSPNKAFPSSNSRI